MSKIMHNEELYNFLIYSVFGIVDEDENLDKKIKCAHRAYRDLARTLRYKYSSSELEHAKKDPDVAKFKKDRDSWVKEICEELINSIEGFPKDGDFNQWHKDKCGELIKKTKGKDLFKEGHSFTWGHAQKWLNMTLKYLWLMDLLPEEISPRSLHVPIDSYILDALKEKPLFEGSIKASKYNGQAWSAMSEDNYKQLQSEIRAMPKEENESPIEWEGRVWIKMANKGNSNKSNSK